MYIGIDCGTQGTKVIVYDQKARKIVSDGYEKHDLVALENGRREQDPKWWIAALDVAMHQALDGLGEKRKDIRAIGVSGQQHGLVVLDGRNDVIRPAKLWNDTETARENAELIEALGGDMGTIEKIGTSIPVGYTASKLLWMKKHEPELFSRISMAFNPKDYINYYLSGVLATDIGSASGTGYFNVNTLTWSDEVVSLMDPSGILAKALPTLALDGEPVGTITKEIARRYGLEESVLVAPGSGDNMMASLGTGTVEDGTAAMTLGTSGVINMYSSTNRPFFFDPITQIQCAGNGGWIPSVMTMNATSTSTAYQELFSLSVKEFDRYLETSSPGAEGVVMVPYLNGERMPALPGSKGVVAGLTFKTLTPENLIRASAESVIFNLRWGRDLLTKNTGAIEVMKITGGGSNSAPWRQITADIMNTEIIGVTSKESGSLGAALQAMWVDGQGDITQLCKDHVELDYSKHATPNPEATEFYNGVYESYLDVRMKMYGV